MRWCGRCRDSAEGLSIAGITYDQQGRLLEVAPEGLDHLIGHPQDIYLDETSKVLAVVQAINAEGRNHIIRNNHQ